MTNKSLKILRRRVFLFLLILGIFLVMMSFVSELNFHYLQGFQQETVSQDIFWRAERAEVLNSLTFIILGSGLIILAIFLKIKRKK